MKKYVRKPQYIMAPETPLLLFHCGFQGLSFHCHPGTLMHGLFPAASVCMFLQLLSKILTIYKMSSLLIRVN